MITKRSILHSHPIYLRVEVCPYCNLRCPGCLLGGLNMSESNPDHRKSGAMKYEVFKDSIKDFIPYLFRVWLYDEGEPLLNKDIYKILYYLNKNNVGTCVSSNFSFPMSNDNLEELINSGLQHLIISVDGATQESYSQYRIGGNLNLVLSNIQRLQSLLNQKKNKHLKVEIQFLEFDHNKSDREQMCKIAKELGVWRLTIIEGCSVDGIDVKQVITKEKKYNKGCYEIWLGTTINSIGELGTCDYGEDFGIPNIGMAKDYRIGKLRNHKSLIQLRKSFGERSIPLHDICQNCFYSIK